MRRALLVAIALLSAACLEARSPIAPTAPLDEPFQLKAGATAVVPGGLAITFDKVISDSRCPINAICVWAGEAVIAMSLSRSGRPDVEHEWRTNPTAFEVSYSGFAIQLLGLQPHPFAGHPTPPADYVATLKVTKR